MRDRLPQIELMVRTGSPRQWFDCIAHSDIAGWRCLGMRTSVSTTDILLLEFDYAGQELPHLGLFAQLIHREASREVQLEMRAKHWEPEPPTYGAYVQAAHGFLNSLRAGGSQCSTFVEKID